MDMESWVLSTGENLKIPLCLGNLISKFLTHCVGKTRYIYGLPLAAAHHLRSLFWWQGEGICFITLPDIREQWDISVCTDAPGCPWVSVCMGWFLLRRDHSEGSLCTGTWGRILPRKGELAARLSISLVQKYCAKLGRFCPAQPGGFYSHHHLWAWHFLGLCLKSHT